MHTEMHKGVRNMKDKMVQARELWRKEADTESPLFVAIFASC